MLHPGEYEWRQLSPAQEQQQRQRGRDLAKLKPWVRSRIGKIEKQISSTMTVGRFSAWVAASWSTRPASLPG